MQKLSNKSKICGMYGIFRVFGMFGALRILRVFKIFIRLLDLLFPRSILGGSRGRFMGGFSAKFDYSNYLNYRHRQGLVAEMSSSHKVYAGVTYFMEYQDVITKKMLWQFKYYLKPQSLAYCTYILYDELIAEMSDRITYSPFSRPNPLVHCPSSTYFKSGKKFDHMKELVVEFDTLQNADAPFFVCCTHAILPNLKSSSDTGIQAQHTGSKKERFEWASKRFLISEKFEQYLRENYLNKNSEKSDKLGRIDTIYCIDDVVTTGASLKAISKLFQSKFNVHVKTFCLSH